MWIPSFLTLPISLPSLPSISLPANIQRRFLSYVLKRALGKFVVASGLDVERVQAQISQGLVELEQLEINTEEINSYIPDGLPFTVVSGEVAKVTARVPFPNLWSAPLSLSVDSLTLEVAISPLAAKGKGPHPQVHLEDLMSSMTSEAFTAAADDFVHDELDAFEGAELDRSIRESLILSHSDPFSNDDVPGSFPPANDGVETTTVLAGLVERVLARLEVKVRNIRLRVRYEDDDRSGVLELRVGEIRYADETPEETAVGPRKRIRVVSVSDVGVYLLPLPPTPSPSPNPLGLRPGVSRSSSMSSDTSSDTASTQSSDSHAEYHDMVMSQAVYDLRQSSMTSASGMSVYHSVIDEGGDEPSSPLASPDMERVSAPVPLPPLGEPEAHQEGASAAETSRDTSRSATPPPGPSTPAETLLLSFGSEDITVRMTTTSAYVPPVVTHPASPRPSPPMSPPLSSPPLSSPPSLLALGPSPASLEVELSIGTIAAVLLPSHVAFLLAVAQAAVGGPPAKRAKQPEAPASEPAALQPRFDARVRVKGVYIAVVYDTNRPTDEYHSTAPQFFSRPSSVLLPVGHLRLRLEEIVAAYNVPATTPPPRVKRDRKAKPTPPKPPVITLTIADASVFEYLASAETGDDEPPGGSFPVLIFDANLPKQYDVAPGASWGTQPTHSRTPANLPSFPEFDSVDWRNSGAQKRSGERAWRVRPKGKGILRSTVSPEPPSRPAISIRKELSKTDAAAIELLPVHVFLDLSLVERLLPLLRSLAPLIQSKSEPTPTPAAPATALQGVAPRPMLSLRTAGRSNSIIDDLDAQAAFRQQRARPSPPRTLLTLRVPMIRLDIRCPAPPNRRGSWGDGAHLRSGIVTLDIHGLNTSVTDTPVSPAATAPGRRASTGLEPQPKGGINVEWQRMVFLFSRVPAGSAGQGGQARRKTGAEATSEKRSTAFLVIGPLAPDGDEAVLLPTVNVQSEVAPMTGLKTQSVTCRIPSVQAQIRQTTVEGLQFFADDMTHWLDGAFGDGSAPRPRDDLKMIGSRFFGSKASSSASSSAVDDEDDDPGATLLRVMISECEVVLIVPKAEVDPEAPERILSLHASDVDVKLESNATDKQETSITLQAMDASLFHHANPTSKPSRLFGRTTSLSFTGHTQPLINLRFSSITHADRTKETGIRFSASACGVFITKELDWVHDLRLYAKTPEGVFEDVVPSEITRIHLLLSDVSARVDTPTLPGALVAVASVLEVRTAIESDADDSQVDIGLSGIHLLAVDDLAATTDLADLQSGFTQSLDAWKRAGYAHLVDIAMADVQILRSLVPQETVLVDVQNTKVKVTACADSFASLGALAGDLAKLAPQKPEPATDAPKKPRPMALDQTIDVFASVDMSAFGQAPDIVSGADMIEDDLPTNLDYLDHAARQHMSAPRTDKRTGETLRSWETTDDADHITEGHHATIKVFMPEAFEQDAGYWDNLPILKNGEETRMGRTRIRVHNCSVGVFLHDGYDWQRTRKAIEDEIKAMRRRLEKIKQLLASGQKADASIEQANSLLFNSVYIGLPPEREDMDSAQLMAAIDEELLDLGDETATESSWQPLPKGNAGYPSSLSHSAVKKSRMKLHGKRLTRSKRGQLEFSLSGLKADIDIYAPDDETASRVHVTASSFEILDHIKTSTWKKFLTEMRSDSRGNVRETDADMVRLEIVNVRPNMPSTDEEIRVRAKILPLRLHVDQDALDFLKHFFAFSPPGNEAPVEPVVDAPPKVEPFFQFVEIFPVELKLDYKPKRVDYAALRQGKTIELMNFFHFDGAEMTLRHVTLSGITGSTRLSDMLQDIWTPDVKANQLADVISGVSPIRSMVNVGSGVADLILLPIEQYRKDGRLARGVQRGTNSFVKSTALEMMKLGARLATGTQVVLEKTEGMLGEKTGDSVILEARGDDFDDDEDGEKGIGGSSRTREEKSRYANQPTNVREGLRGAYSSLSSNFNSAAQTILAVPMEVYERSGEDGPLKAVVRAVPIAVLKPMIGASEAVSKTLWGLRNSLDPEGRRETDDKYK